MLFRTDDDTVVIGTLEGRLIGHLAASLAANLREAFIRVACGYGGLSDGLDWFEAPPLWSVAMRYFALGGYAEQNGPLFRWTAKIGPAMRSAGSWDEEWQSPAALVQAESEADAELAWQTMPDTLRHSLRSSKIGFLELVKVLALGWRDGRWQDFNRDSPVELSGQMRLAKFLLERARSS